MSATQITPMPNPIYVDTATHLKKRKLDDVDTSDTEERKTKITTKLREPKTVLPKFHAIETGDENKIVEHIIKYGTGEAEYFYMMHIRIGNDSKCSDDEMNLDIEYIEIPNAKGKSVSDSDEMDTFIRNILCLIVHNTDARGDYYTVLIKKEKAEQCYEYMGAFMTEDMVIMDCSIFSVKLPYTKNKNLYCTSIKSLDDDDNSTMLVHRYWDDDNNDD